MDETGDFTYFTVGEILSSARVGGPTRIPWAGILAGLGELRQITGYSMLIKKTESPKIEIRVK